VHLHTKGLVPDRGWKSPRTFQDDPTVWMGARRELSLHRNKGQSTNTVMKRMSLHLGTPNDHHQEALRKCGWEESMEMTSWN